MVIGIFVEILPKLSQKQRFENIDLAEFLAECYSSARNFSKWIKCGKDKAMSRRKRKTKPEKVPTEIKKTASEIWSYETEIDELSNAEIQTETDQFRDNLANGRVTDTEILPKAYALVLNVCKRLRGQTWEVQGNQELWEYEQRETQVFGGIALYGDNVVEMKNGEGKTLAATMPAYLGALYGKGVHIATANEYLAERDAQWMGPVYSALGLSVGVRLNNVSYQFIGDGRYLEECSKQQAYMCDVTYSTFDQFAFDYLWDNLATSRRDIVQRGQNFIIVDEADYILINRAMIPIMITSNVGNYADNYKSIYTLVRQLEPGVDFNIVSGSPELTNTGTSRIKRLLGIDDLYSVENSGLARDIINALYALYVLRNEIDYIIENSEIALVDKDTGRPNFSMKFGNRLHQFVELLNNLPVSDDCRVLAQIIVQNYFRLYRKKAGMTGTVETGTTEFRDVYGLGSVIIHPWKPIIREDWVDKIYQTKMAKYNAICNEIEYIHEQGRPVLAVGDMESSERLSEMLGGRLLFSLELDLDRKDFWKNLRQEFKNNGFELSPSAKFWIMKADREYLATDYDEEQTYVIRVEAGKINIYSGRTIRHRLLNARTHQEEAEVIKQAGQLGVIVISTAMMGRGTDIKLGIGVKDKGGLHVIGVERNLHRRIDRQLQGRAGRQGDPGSSRFFLSLEDSLMQRFGGARLKRWLERSGMDEETPVEHRWVS